MKRILLGLLLGGVLQTAHAGIGLDFYNNLVGFTGICNNGVNCTFGWSFSVDSPIAVTALGIWDEGHGGLKEPHDVGLWTNDGLTLLASAKVTNASSSVDSSAFPIGQWLFQGITDVVLGAGTYRIGAFYSNGSQDAYRHSAAITTPDITFVAPVGIVDPSSSLVFPDSEFSSVTAGVFGPNFLTTEPPPLPEPSSIALLAVGIVGLGLSLARCQRMLL